MWLLLYLVCLISLVASKNEDYKGYKIYEISLLSEHQQENLFSLKADEIDYLRKPSFRYGVPGLAMLPPSDLDWFEDQLTELGIPVNVFSEDVYEYLTDTLKDTERKSGDTFNIRSYQRYDDILTYLRELSERYSTGATRVELMENGLSYENRPLVYLRISNVNAVKAETRQKPVIVVEAGIIPREWITIPAALNIVERVLEEHRYLEGADWIILPVVNPDGYEYTHTNFRLWSKSRSTRSNLGFRCPGVNINRNFDIFWLRSGSSSSPCSHLYAGIEPFSETETQFVHSIISQYGSRIKLYISLQNNGGFISYPWSYERAASGLFVPHFLLGLEMAKAPIETYNLGVSSIMVERASGTSSDYARVNGIFYPYIIDIVQRDHTVVIPESDIGAIVDDVWRIVTVAANEIIK